jgi:hypothetical protein
LWRLRGRELGQVQDSHEVAAQRYRTAAYDQEGQTRIGTCPSGSSCQNTTRNVKVLL